MLDNCPKQLLSSDNKSLEILPFYTSLYGINLLAVELGTLL